MVIYRLASSFILLSVVLLQPPFITQARRLADEPPVGPCPGNSDLRGHLDVASFVRDMEGGATGFLLCPGVVYNEQLTVPPAKFMVAMTCVDPGEECIWEVDGGSHVIIQRSDAVSVNIRGITFKGATETSIQMMPNGVQLVQFNNCTWQNNTGSAVLEIITGTDVTDTTTEATNTTANTTGGVEPVDAQAQVNLADCFFEGNTVTESVLYTNAANLFLTDCDFQNNEAQDSVVSLNEGLHVMVGVTFENNTIVRTGVIYLAAMARLNASESCGVDNTAGTCNGTFSQVANPDNCVNLNDLECSPACFSYTECGAKDCVASLEALQEALATGGEIELCSTTFDLSDLDEPLEIGDIAVSLICKETNCVFEGGNEQFRIVDGATDVSFHNITFAASQSLSVSVEIDPGEPAVITFVGCVWRSHFGKHALLVQPPEPLQDGDELEAYVEITNSLFVDNTVDEYVVENGGLELSINACVFRENAGSKGVVGALGGETVIAGASGGDRETILENNEVDIGLVVVGLNNTGFDADDVCGQNNVIANSCNGAYYEASDPAQCREDSDNEEACEETCIPIEKCNSLPPDCFSVYAELSAAIQARPFGSFEICAAARLNLDGSEDVIELNQPGVMIKCGNDGSRKNNCVIEGGSYHFVVNTTSAGFYGITFLGADAVSVQVILDSALDSSIFFTDCYWGENNGVDTFEILSNKPDAASGSRRLEDADTEPNRAVVEISDSSFLRNIASGNIISNKAANLIVSKSEFNQNEAGQSVIVLSTANTTMTDVKFVENVFNNGVIFVDFTAGLNHSICGLNNTAGDIPCDGIFLQSVDSEECLEGDVDACRAGCTSLGPCDDVAECYSEWTSLVEAIGSSDGGDSFVVCPGSEMFLRGDDSLLLTKDDTVLRCGEDGERSNRCVFVGGRQQVTIYGTVSGIRIEGITFVASSEMSVAAFGDVDSSATLYGCEFSGHAGEAAIIVSNEADLSEGNFLTDASASPSMQVTIDSCLFDDNLVEVAPIANFQGDVRVTNTSFHGNTGLDGAGAIVSYSALSVSESCFVGNKGNVSGSILLSLNAPLTFYQERNFGDNNGAVFGNCTDILMIDESSSCDEFESSECLASFPVSGAPTLATDPSLSSTPSAEPSGILPPSPTPSSIDSAVQSFPSIAPTPLGPCYNVGEWEDLFNAVKDSEGNETFTICADTVVNMADMEARDLAPLLIRASGITIECGSQRRNACVLSGGSTHILLRKSIKNVKVHGITMERASAVSVAGTPSIPFLIEFENCEWKNNTGIATVEIVAIGNTNPLSGNESVVGGRELQTVDDNYFLCDQCLFEDNTASNFIITASGTSLVLDAIVLRGNVYDKSVISIDSGSVLIKDSCVEDTESNGPLLVADDSKVVTEAVFLSGNSGSGCAGYVDVGGNCVEADISLSCIAEEKRCYSHWLDLSDAFAELSSADEGLVFTICEGAILDVSNSAPIEITQTKTTIRCGLNGARDSNCLVRGGGVQFQILGAPRDVVFSGITFSGASIAAINAAGERSSRAQIVDCLFKDMATGQAALLIYAGDIPSSPRGGRRLAIGDYNEPIARSMTVEISYSSFSSNTVGLAALANLQGTLVVADCDFDQNSGSAGAIGEWFGGSMSLSNSCFTDNTGELAGSVYIDGDSTTENGNHGDGNTVTDGDCSDLLLSKATLTDGSPAGLCMEFSEGTCDAQEAPTVAPTVAPTLPALARVPTVGASPSPTRAPLDCLDNWDDLVTAIADNFTVGIKNVFTLCPDATLQAGDDPILLNQDNGDLLFQCGREGALNDNCVISGGNNHLRIAAVKIDVAFIGMTFENSKGMSIIAAADQESTARFDECQWTGHSGRGVVLIYYEALGQVYDGNTPISELPLSGNSMAASFEKCIFKENPVKYAAVSNIGGTAIFSLTAFDEHMDTSAATIVARSGAELYLSNSCFIKNDSNLPGTVFLAEGAELRLDEGNYGFDNRVGITICTDIFTLAPDEGCNQNSCPGACSTFVAKKCKIPGYEFDAPSVTPSASPPPFPTADGASPSGKVAVTLEETSLFASGFFARNFLVALIVASLGFAAFFYCKSQHGPKKDGKAKLANVESAPAPGQEDIDRFQEDRFQEEENMLPRTDSVILNPDVVVKKEKKKKKGGGFFGLGGKKKREKEELQPIIDMPPASSEMNSTHMHQHSLMQSNTYSYDGRSRDDDGDSSGDERDEMVLS